MAQLHLTLRLINPEIILPDARTCAEAAAIGVSELVIAHLRERNAGTVRRAGMPKTDYWADAADSVRTEVHGGRATVTVEKEGAALHYHGGTVYPKKKALAVPIDPKVAGIWPSEGGGDLEVFWPRNSAHGFLKDPGTGDLLYLLLPKAVIPADPTVLPTDEAMLRAAGDAIMEAIA